MPGRDLAIVIACFGQPKMMARQEESWLSWPKNLQDRVEVVVVDDHGDPPYKPGPEFDPALPFPEGKVEPGIELKVYRVDTQIPWNQMGARNLGMKEAESSWRLMLDPDMVLTAPNLARIFELFPRFRRGHHYKPKLGKNSKKPYGSPNLYICHEADFWKSGGYNEDFAGAKGYSDVVLHRTLVEFSRRHFLDRIWLEFLGPRDVSDARVEVSAGVNRDLAVNHKKFAAAAKFAAQNSWKFYAQGVRDHVRFPWHRVR